MKLLAPKKDHIIIGLSCLSLILLAATISAYIPAPADGEYAEASFGFGGEADAEKAPGFWPEVTVPEEMDFCGERVPLQETEIYERMDREIQSNTYFHSHTIQIMKNAERYFPRIEEILKEEGVPDDFKYLAVAESSLQNVVSPAKAVGFWQFLAGTGKDYGLEIRDEVDERYHWEKSTRAACKYLKDAHAKFGNWTDVAVSYNMGMGGMQSARKSQKVDSYYDLKLTWEPTRYIFRIIALKEIMKNPAKYRYKLDPKNTYNLNQVEYVTVEESIPDLISFALSHGISYKSLLYHNQWLRGKSLTIKQKGGAYKIAIPTEKRNKLR